jgi:hypothetical protein
MGLLRGVARTAVIAGTATAVSNNVSRRQSARWADQQAQQQPQYQEPPPPPPMPAQDDMDARIEQLEKLAQLRDQGILTDAEFQSQKQQLLT